MCYIWVVCVIDIERSNVVVMVEVVVMSMNGDRWYTMVPRMVSRGKI